MDDDTREVARRFVRDTLGNLDAGLAPLTDASYQGPGHQAFAQLSSDERTAMLKAVRAEVNEER